MRDRRFDDPFSFDIGLQLVAVCDMARRQGRA